MPPAVALLACALASGIAMREALAVQRWTGLVLLACTSVVLAAWGWRRRVMGVAALAQAVALGVVLAESAWPRPPPGLLDGVPWDVTARLVEAPDRAFGRTHILLALESVARDGVAREAAGRIRIAMPGDPVEPLLPGDRVRLR